ncbi:zinc ribbon domain-containing protein [Candidatus Peregrinibacteria bacterium]|nr:zinc ribbon domain-containing protein [Candidatus Peregrinibacteria bacterium]
MPRFDFQCDQCGHIFESTLPFGIKTLPFCPLCGRTTQKCIAPPCIHFKGQGFYKTDSAASPVTPLKETTDKSTNDKKPEKKENKCDKKEKDAGNAKK